VKFEVEGDPAMMAICHCTDCQHEGGAFSATAVYAADKFKWTSGSATTYEATGASGKNVKHTFCANCGSSLTSAQEVLVLSQ